jgi:hypothetical protein
MKCEGETFQFLGWELTYFRHVYNRASQNMRTVEVPIARQFIANAGRAARILEVGNVLSHYGPISWPVVDLRETGLRIVTTDVMTWRPTRKLDLIVSISTLEHIGFGQYRSRGSVIDPAAVIARLRGWLDRDGALVATVPTRYNPAWDAHLRAGTLGADRLHAMRQIISREIDFRHPGGWNLWEECSVEEALDAPRRIWSGGMVVVIAGGR